MPRTKQVNKPGDKSMYGLDKTYWNNISDIWGIQAVVRFIPLIGIMRLAIQILALILCVDATAQVEINFYTKKVKEKYRFTPDSVVISDIEFHSKKDFKHINIEQAKKGNGNFICSDRKIDWIEFYIGEKAQGLNLGFLTDSFSRIDFIVDTAFDSMSPLSIYTKVKVRTFYKNGTSYKIYNRPPESERALYKQKANLYLAIEKKDNFFSYFFLQPSESSGLFIQGRYSRDFGMNFIGVQVKRHAGETELGVSTWNDQELGVSFADFENKSYATIDGNIGILAFPFTFIFTIGVGGNYTFGLGNKESVFAVYPKISLSFGGVSLMYSFKQPIQNNLNHSFNNNSITLAFGPAIFRK